MLRMMKITAPNAAGSCRANVLSAVMNTRGNRRIVPGADVRYQPIRKKSWLMKTWRAGKQNTTHGLFADNAISFRMSLTRKHVSVPDAIGTCTQNRQKKTWAMPAVCWQDLC